MVQRRKTALIGRTFALDPNFSGPFNVRLYDAGGLPTTITEPYYTPEGSQYFGVVTENWLRGQGWVLIAVPGSGHARRRVQDFSGFSTASIEQGTADVFYVTINQDMTLFAGVALAWASYGFIRVFNADAVAHNLYLGAGTYVIPSGDSRYFVCLGDSLYSIQFTAPLIP